MIFQMSKYSGLDFAGSFSSGCRTPPPAPARRATAPRRRYQLHDPHHEPHKLRTQLSIPSSSQFPSQITRLIENASFDFARILSSPSLGLEGQDAFLPGAMVCDFHIAIMIDLRSSHNETANTRSHLLPAVVLPHIAFAQSSSGV